jgi:molybdopterin-guanine dinucleotide biosynthesis protein A
MDKLDEYTFCSQMRSAVILAGGEARRVNGREKYFFTYGGMTFIERQIGALRKVVDEIVVVARDPGQCARFGEIEGIRCVSDVHPGLGPIGGLQAGTIAVNGEMVFLAACDMPCIQPAVVEHLFSLAGTHDAVIPCWNQDMYEPLHAVYRTAAIRQYLTCYNSYSLRQMIRSISTRFVPANDLREIDPDLRTFTNINKLEELELIKGSISFGENKK